jgi:hypothetical protein
MRQGVVGICPDSFLVTLPVPGASHITHTKRLGIRRVTWLYLSRDLVQVQCACTHTTIIIVINMHTTIVSFIISYIIPEHITLPDIGHKSFDPGRKVVELGGVPLPGGAAPAGEVGRGAHGHGEREQRLGDHGEAEEGEGLEEVVRAGDEAEQPAAGDPVRPCHTRVLGIQSPGANINTRCAGTKSHTYDA